MIISDKYRETCVFAKGLPRALTVAIWAERLRYGSICTTATDYYDGFSLWDIYRAQHPLITLLHPTQSGEMMQSLIEKCRQGGWLPIFPCWSSYTAAMIGDTPGGKPYPHTYLHHTDILRGGVLRLVMSDRAGH